MQRGKHVRLVIRTDGSCSVDAMNFTDATCQQATQQILHALGGLPVEERFKPECQRLSPQAERQMEGQH